MLDFVQKLGRDFIKDMDARDFNPLDLKIKPHLVFVPTSQLYNPISITIAQQKALFVLGAYWSYTRLAFAAA